MVSLLRWLESGEFILEDIAVEPIWLLLAVFVLATLGIGTTIAIHGVAHFDLSRAVATLEETQAAQTQAARATIYPPQTIADPAIGATAQPNCTSGWCSEKIIHQRSTDGDHFIGYATLTGTNKRSEVVTFTTSGLDASGVAQNVTITGRLTLGSTDSLRYASIPITSISTDPRNPAALVITAYLKAVGASPVVRQINWGDPYDVGTNNVEIDQASIAGVTTTTGMAIATLPAKNLVVTVGFATPTPLPTFQPEAGTLVYYWPQNVAGVGGAQPGPSSFQVHLRLYHDAYFAEAATCAQPSPAYVPGSSPAYIPGAPPSGMFGAAGPWVYPNPNPLSPPNQDSGPATFGIAPSAAGFCAVPIYTTYTPRSGQILTSEPTPFPVAAQVMDWLTLSQGSSSATPQTAPLGVTGTLQKPGDTVSINITKRYDTRAAATFGGSPVTISANCSAFLQGTVGGATQSGNDLTATLQLQVIGNGNTSGSTASCSGTVQDAFNELPVHFAFAVQPYAPMKTWPADLVLGAGGASVGPTNGSPATLADAGWQTPNLARLLNGVLGGGVAVAAQPCYAQAFLTDGKTPDTTPTAAAIAVPGLGQFGVTTDGCMTLNGVPVSASQAGMIAYEPDGAGASFSTSGSTCAPGTVAVGSWIPNLGRNDVEALLPAQGQSAGNCNVTLSDGSSGAATPDQGLVAVNVQNTYTWVVSYTQSNGTTKVEYSTGNPGPCCGSNGTSSITWTLQASNGQTVPNCAFTASGVDTNPSGNAISSYQASGCPSGYTDAWFAPSPATMVYVSLGIWDSYDTTQLYNVAGGLMTPIPNCSYVLEMNWQPWDPLKYRTLNSAQITSPTYSGCPSTYPDLPGYW
ncbi:hypothetical protein EPN42_01260 [bacterium]|nr:MAG: hypothetical protein EPN42_01260 [bacterium]